MEIRRIKIRIKGKIMREEGKCNEKLGEMN